MSSLVIPGAQKTTGSLLAPQASCPGYFRCRQGSHLSVPLPTVPAPYLLIGAAAYSDDSASTARRPEPWWLAARSRKGGREK